jgi:hypothetical protein
MRTGRKNKVSISPAVPDPDAANTLAEVKALTFTPIGGVDGNGGIGEYGDAVGFATASTLEDARMQRAKTIADAGEWSLTCLDNPDDLGQAAMLAAVDSEFEFVIKIEKNNKKTSGGTNQIDYFRVLVGGARFQPGGNDGVQRRVFNCAINSETWTDPAT